MVAVITFHPGKTQMKVTAVQIFVFIEDNTVSINW